MRVDEFRNTKITVAPLLLQTRDNFTWVCARLATGFVDGDNSARRAKRSIERCSNIASKGGNSAFTRRIRPKQKHSPIIPGLRLLTNL